MNILVLPDNSQQIFYTDIARNKKDAGFDIFCPDNITIHPGQTVRVNMKVKCVFDKNGVSQHYFLMSRSSIDKTPLLLSNGVGMMDKNYRGYIIASFRHIVPNAPPYEIKRGQRLVQLVPMSGEEFDCKIVDSLNETSRGEGGFGSTG